MACLKVEGLIPQAIIRSFVGKICSQSAAKPSQNFYSVPGGRWVRVGNFWLYTNFSTTLQDACASQWERVVISAWQDTYHRELAAVEAVCYQESNVFVIRWRTNLDERLLAHVRRTLLQSQQAIAAK